MSSVNPYALSLFIGIIELIAQNGSDIDFIDDIYFTLFARMSRMPSYDYTVYQFIAHFAGKFGRFKILLYVPYKLIRALYRVRRFGKPLFKLRYFRFEFLLLLGISLQSFLCAFSA